MQASKMATRAAVGSGAALRAGCQRQRSLAAFVPALAHRCKYRSLHEPKTPGKGSGFGTGQQEFNLERPPSNNPRCPDSVRTDFSFVGLNTITNLDNQDSKAARSPITNHGGPPCPYLRELKSSFNFVLPSMY
jgi:hypothetical protein